MILPIMRLGPRIWIMRVRGERFLGPLGDALHQFLVQLIGLRVKARLFDVTAVIHI